MPVQRNEHKLWNLPQRCVEDFRYALIGLMPRGFAWFTGVGGNWWKLFSGFAAGILTAYNMLRLLVKESSPVSTTEIVRWENELGLAKKGIEIDRDQAGNKEI